jgi:hypothetical protein|tara:strand:- start:672 stop:848 length:177 start_codon:yes stop_codon:yes gene_type:complete
MFSKYLKDDKTLDYQAVYNDMYRITGFNSKRSREKLYEDVTEWYKDFKKANDPHKANI